MEEPVVDISGLDKAAVLAALFNRAGTPRPGSAAMLHYTPMPMSVEEARAVIEERLARPYSSGYILFDYLEGRCLKIDITGDTFDAWLYDREYGPGAAQRAIDELCGGYTSNRYRRNARKGKKAKRKKKQAKLDRRFHSGGDPFGGTGIMFVPFRRNPYRQNVDERLQKLRREALDGDLVIREKLIRARARSGELLCDFPKCDARVYSSDNGWYCFDCDSAFCPDHAYCLLGCMADNVPICCTADARPLEDCRHIEYEDDNPDRAICALHSICCFPGCEIAADEFARGTDEDSDTCPSCGRVFCDEHSYCLIGCEADDIPLCCTADTSPLGDYLCRLCGNHGGFLCADHVITCSLCQPNDFHDNRLCPNHIANCVICERVVCTDEESDCFQSCAKCRSELCRECAVRCECERTYCPPCLPGGMCEDCEQAERSQQRAERYKKDKDFQEWLKDDYA